MSANNTRSPIELLKLSELFKGLRKADLEPPQADLGHSYLAGVGEGNLELQRQGDTGHQVVNPFRSRSSVRGSMVANRHLPFHSHVWLLPNAGTRYGGFLILHKHAADHRENRLLWRGFGGSKSNSLTFGNNRPVVSRKDHSAVYPGQICSKSGFPLHRRYSADANAFS